MRRNRGDHRRGEPLRTDGKCAVCGETLKGHLVFGACYRQAMSGAVGRGRTGAELTGKVKATGRKRWTAK